MNVDQRRMHEVDMTKCLLISLNEWRDRREDPSMVETVISAFSVERHQSDHPSSQLHQVTINGLCRRCNGTTTPCPKTTAAMPPLPLSPLQSSVSAETNTPLLPCICP